MEMACQSPQHYLNLRLLIITLFYAPVHRLKLFGRCLLFEHAATRLRLSSALIHRRALTHLFVYQAPGIFLMQGT